MLVKIGHGASINMTGIQRVNIENHKETEKVPGKGFFEKDKEIVRESIAVKVHYTDHKGLETTYTLYGFKSLADAQVVYKEVLDQVKELENVGATQALEEAIRNG